MESYRLSPQQKHLWTLWRTSPDACWSRCVVRLKGPVRPDALESAVQEAVRRHGILRTTFQRKRGLKVPLQVIDDQGAAAWREIDVRDRSEEQKEEALRDLLHAGPPPASSVEEGPVFHAVLLRLGPESALLGLALPALCADARTLGNLVGEILAPAREADDPAQYEQFSEWQNELLEESPDEAERYWNSLSGEARTSLRLPLELSAEGERESSFQPRFAPVAFTPETAAGIDSLARERESEAAVVLLAGWQALLHRLSGRAELTLSVVLDNRGQEDLESMAGPLAKALLVLCRVTGGESFADLVRKCHGALQEVSDLVEVLPPGLQGESLRPSDSPVGCDIREWPSPAGIESSLEALSTCLERCKLRLECVREGDRWLAGLSYDPLVFTAEDMERTARRFEALIATAVRSPGTAVGELPIVGQ
ncbi:MAG: condensation domain-containing protein, partial [Acidobacteriota bacterium]